MDKIEGLLELQREEAVNGSVLYLYFDAISLVSQINTRQRIVANLFRTESRQLLVSFILRCQYRIAQGGVSADYMNICAAGLP